MTEKQIIGLIMLIGIPLICCILIALCVDYWMKKIKGNKKQIQEFIRETLNEDEPEKVKSKIKISNSEADFQRWKKERENT